MKKNIKIGIIPAAGRGNRISELPLTRVLPKPMLPILNRPILEYIIEVMKGLEVEIIYLIIGYKKEIIREYFKDGTDFGVKIKYIEQKEPRGIAHAINLTKQYLNNPFLVILGDDFTIAKSLQNLINEFWQKKSIVTEGVVYEDDNEILKQTNYVILGKDNRIKKIIEKPDSPKTHFRGCGIYIFHPKIFKYIKKTPISSKRNEQEISDTIGLVAQDKKAYASLINGVNININTLENLIFAMRLFLKKYKGLSFDYKSIQSLEK